MIASLFCSMMTRWLPCCSKALDNSVACTEDAGGSGDLFMSGKLAKELFEASWCTVRCRSLKLTTLDNSFLRERLSWQEASSMVSSFGGEPFSGIGFKKSNILAPKADVHSPAGLGY